MHSRLAITLAAATLLAAPCMASATVLYKSISPTGVVQFSDVPPSDRSVLVEQRAVPSRAAPAVASSDLPPRQGNLDGLPYVVEDAGGALARANAQLDLAEHALAETLRTMGSTLENMRLKGHGAGDAGNARIDFFRRNVQAARENLMNVLRAQGPAAPTAVASTVPPLASR